MTQDLGEIQRLVSQGRYEFGIRAQRERLEEDLAVVEMEEAIGKGVFLEESSKNTLMTRGVGVVWSWFSLAPGQAKVVTPGDFLREITSD